jgi:hypothetical protein
MTYSNYPTSYQSPVAFTSQSTQMNYNPATIVLPPQQDQSKKNAMEQIIHARKSGSNQVSGSMKMLVISSNGEPNRVLKFHSPKGSCTVGKVLDQFGINVEPGDKIECIENRNSVIDYVLKVGNIPPSFDIDEMVKAAEIKIKQQRKSRSTIVV